MREIGSNSFGPGFSRDQTDFAFYAGEFMIRPDLRTCGPAGRMGR